MRERNYQRTRCLDSLRGEERKKRIEKMKVNAVAFSEKYFKV